MEGLRWIDAFWLLRSGQGPAPAPVPRRKCASSSLRMAWRHRFSVPSFSPFVKSVSLTISNGLSNTRSGFCLARFRSRDVRFTLSSQVARHAVYLLIRGIIVHAPEAPDPRLSVAYLRKRLCCHWQWRDVDPALVIAVVGCWPRQEAVLERECEYRAGLGHQNDPDFNIAYVLRHEEPKDRPHNWDLREQRTRTFARFRLFSLPLWPFPVAMACHPPAVLTIKLLFGFF
jgi:hypothetical protein